MNSFKRSGIGELFDIIGEEFDSKRNYFAMHQQQMFRFCDYCFENEKIKGQTCLDAGCGTGTASLYFAQNGAKRIYGIDLSEKSLQVAKKMSMERDFYNTLFPVADLGSLPFDNETFDVVFSCGVLPYVGNVFNSIAELIRVTRIDGRIVLMVLKKTWLDGIYEFLRMILSGAPRAWKIRFAGFLAFFSHLTAHIFLRRRVNFSQGKPLKQMIMEAFFSPVKLQRLNYKDIQSFFENSGFRIFSIKGIVGVDFYSSHTCFVIKALR